MKDSNFDGRNNNFILAPKKTVYLQTIMAQIKKIFKILFSFCLAAVLLYFSFKGVSWKDFVEGLKTCDWFYIFLAMMCSVVAFLVRSYRWRRLMLPIDPSIKRITAFNAVNIGNVSNFVFPYLGEVVKCGVITRNSPRQEGSNRRVASYDKVLGTMVMERILDAVTAVLIILVLLAFKWDEFGEFFTKKIWSPLQTRLNIGIWIILAFIVLAIVIFCTIIVKYKDRSKFCRKVYIAIAGIFEGFKSCLKMKDKGIFIVQTLIIWLMYWYMIVFVKEAMPELSHLTAIDSLFISMVGSVAAMLPVPGGLGAFHYFVALALASLYGIEWGTGIVFATVAHESQAVVFIILGLISYIWESAKKQK